MKQRLVTTSGPEFAKEEDCSANCVHGKPPRRLQTDFPYQVLVTSGHTTVWQNKVTLQVSISQCSSSGCNQANRMCEDQSSNPWKRPYLEHNPFNRWRIQGQSHAARQNSITAAIPSERSLQLRVNRAPPPRGEADPTPFGTPRCQTGMSLVSVRRCLMAKGERCMQGPCETCETLSSPSMKSVPLCTKLEMSDINSGN